MSLVLVVGSSNTDMVLRLRELPAPGQTLMGDPLQIFAGGKGANQAVAARRAGSDVRFVAALGNDDFGRSAISTFENEGIDTHHVQTIDGISSGVALIFVSDAGENCIGVAPGANDALTPALLRTQEQAFVGADVVLLQLETPIETVVAAAELAARHGARCILNPAPAASLPAALLKQLYCITPNETEAEALTGICVTDDASAIKAASALIESGARNVLLTLGERGALLHDGTDIHREHARSVTVVDTTAAGDTFNGVLAAMLAKGRTLRVAMEVAVAAATESVQVAGAIASIPRLDQ